MASLLIPLISVPFWGWLNPLTLGLLGGFVVLLALFIVVELKVHDPVLDLNLVRRTGSSQPAPPPRCSTTPPSTG